MTPEELRRGMKERGLGPDSLALADVARPGIRLQPVPSGPEEHVPVGSSKLGGLPDVPKGTSWPLGLNGLMEFVVQINLPELQASVKTDLLPPSGLLSFFCDGGGSGGCVFYWDADPKGFLRLEPDLGPEKRHFFGLVRGRRSRVRVYKPCALRLFAALVPPDDRVMTFSEKDLDTLVEYIEAVAGRHSLLGFPQPVQAEMDLDLELESRKLTWMDWEKLGPKERDEFIAAAKGNRDRWRHLLQVDSDDEASDMMWGDAGKLYYWVRTEDLERRRFDRALLLMQCT